MAQLLNQEIFKFILVFLRIGSAIMLMPGFSASYVNMRQRLSIALAVSVVLVPFLNDQLPQPSDLPDAIKMYLFEITYGVFFGLAMQILFSALSLCGNFIGQAIGFSNAQIFDPAFQTQSIVIETFLSVLALTVIFITDIHHLMLSAVIDSYPTPAGRRFLRLHEPNSEPKFYHGLQNRLAVHCLLACFLCRHGTGFTPDAAVKHFLFVPPSANLSGTGTAVHHHSDHDPLVSQIL